jgi:uncharacterized membrane protein
MEQTIFSVLEYFLVYAFLGWCVEVAYQAIKKGLVVNRGFLNGPVCPIYGAGVLTVFILLSIAGRNDPHEMNALVVFGFGIVLATLIELIGGWALDKLFHARWWDYSDQRFNFRGYICLRFSIIWGLGILLIVRVADPVIINALNLIPRTVAWVLIGVFSALFLADTAVSVMVMVGLNKRMAEIDELQARMRVVSNDLSQRIGSGTLEAMEQVDQAKVQTALAKAEVRDQVEQARAGLREQMDQRRTELQEQLDQQWKERVSELQNSIPQMQESEAAIQNRTSEIKDREAARKRLEQKRSELFARIQGSRHFGTGRLLRAFPDMKHRDYSELLDKVKEQL